MVLVLLQNAGPDARCRVVHLLEGLCNVFIIHDPATHIGHIAIGLKAYTGESGTIAAARQVTQARRGMVHVKRRALWECERHGEGDYDESGIVRHHGAS